MAWLTAVMTTAGCAWPTRLDVQPETQNTEPRIVRNLTEPMFAASLPVPGQDEPSPELTVSLCVWEPDLEDVVKVRLYIDYTSKHPTAQVQDLDITPDDATARDPTLRCVTVRQSGICTSTTPPNTIHMVDVVVASGWDKDTAPPHYRAALTGHSDEIRIAVTCE